MKRETWKKCLRACLLALLLFGVSAMIPSTARETQAATAGFKTVGGKTYYIKSNGQKAKGFLTLNGKKYYFDKKTGVQLKGWMKDSKGQKIRYFTSGKGYMVTGFLKDSAGNTRYFDPETGLMVRGWMTDSSGYKYYFSKGAGIMAKGWLTDSRNQKRYFSKTTGRMLTGWQKSGTSNYRYFKKDTGVMLTGLQKIGNYYFYLNKSTGIRYQKGWLTLSGKKYYFAKTNGRARTGWLTVSGKKYYLDSKGVLYRNTTLVIDGKAYTFDSNGVAKATKYTVTNNNVKVYDSKNKKYYYLAKEFIEHPGVANGKVTDRDLLAALCESEAGNQGLIGMEAVALCVLNRTIEKNKEFPSEVRYVIYEELRQGSTSAQYSVVKNGALLKRIKGQYENRTQAYKAADAALKIFNNYVKKGTARKLTGFKKDFNYMYFMMESSFWKQPLNFNKVEYFKYKDHVFFVNWV
ncbi:MAG: cell wall hydrolase [Eubacteriales bacterium]|nr:cell wall hydrolase [Eubacteriales bacterium]